MWWCLMVGVFVGDGGFELICGQAQIGPRRHLDAAAVSRLEGFASCYGVLLERADPSADLLALGRDLYRFLDGDSGELTALIDRAQRPLHFEVATAASRPSAAELALMRAPWELLATDAGLLVADAMLGFSPVRRLGRAETEHIIAQIGLGRPQSGEARGDRRLDRMPKRICLSIAVSKPEKLDPLPGAIQASRDVIAWAAAAGFATLPPVSDADGSPVTVAQLNAILMPILRDPTDIIDHLIIHFASHGIVAGAEDQFLLLSKWRSKPDEAIRLSRFVRLLQFYQPDRVSLFIDACRSRPIKDADDLNGSGILDRPDDEPKEFLEDRFRAVVNATESYMIKDLAGGPPRCLL